MGAPGSTVVSFWLVLLAASPLQAQELPIVDLLGTPSQVEETGPSRSTSPTAPVPDPRRAIYIPQGAYLVPRSAGLPAGSGVSSPTYPLVIDIPGSDHVLTTTPREGVGAVLLPYYYPYLIPVPAGGVPTTGATPYPGLPAVRGYYFSESPPPVPRQEDLSPEVLRILQEMARNSQPYLSPPPRRLAP